MKERRKRSILPALYFTIKLLFQVNPLELSRLCVQKFNRIIGIGIIADVDVVRRISNFYFWFAGFALFFCLFYLLFNYYTPINCEGDRKAISTLYEDFVVIGIVQLFFQGVSFFNKQESLSVEFNYSQGIIILLLFAMIMYMAFHMEKRISSDSYLKNIVIGISLGWVISIIWPSFWNNGEILLFAQGCVLLVLILIAIYLPGLRSKVINLISWDFVVCAASMLPFGISFYIELLNIFNQHGIFVGNPWLLFIIIVNLFFLAVIFVARFLKKGFWHYSQWKNWCFPWLVFGIACLSVQIPLQTIYSADFFEFANFSIPISDFFLKGKIPILENYGGHMMSGVWEGLIYGFVNGDIKGAIFSPYSVYI